VRADLVVHAAKPGERPRAISGSGPSALAT
jgi:hypothetical protein